MELTIAIIAGIGGMLGWGLADFFAKKTIDELGDVITLAWAGVFGTITFLIAIVARMALGGPGFTALPDTSSWFTVVCLGALQGAVYIFAYRAFAKGQVGLLSPIFASFTGVVALVSILFLGETAGLLRETALAITFFGVLVLHADVRALFSMRVHFVKITGITDILIATALAAVWTIWWEQFVSGGDWLACAFYMFLAMTTTVFLFAWMRGLRFSVQRSELWIFLAAIGVCETVAYIAITLGYSATSLVSVVAVLSGAFSLPTIVLAHLFLRERTTTTQRVGSILTIAGIVLLSVL